MLRMQIMTLFSYLMLLGVYFSPIVFLKSLIALLKVLVAEVVLAED